MEPLRSHIKKFKHNLIKEYLNVLRSFQNVIYLTFCVKIALFFYFLCLLK